MAKEKLCNNKYPFWYDSPNLPAGSKLARTVSWGLGALDSVFMSIKFRGVAS